MPKQETETVGVVPLKLDLTTIVGNQATVLRRPFLQNGMIGVGVVGEMIDVLYRFVRDGTHGGESV